MGDAPVESHSKCSHLHNLFSETFCIATIGMRYIRFSIFCILSTLTDTRRTCSRRHRRCRRVEVQKRIERRQRGAREVTATHKIHR